MPGNRIELVRILHDGFPYMEGRRATDFKFAIQIRLCRGTGKSFLLLPTEEEFKKQ